MELRQLEYFLDLCKTSNFTQTADNLCVTQPSVTKAIQQLEAELGVPLFDRSQKPIAMTAEGRRFRDRVAVILKELQDAAREVSQMSRGYRQTVSIGLSPRVGLRLKQMLTSREGAPPQDILFNIVERSSPDICAMLLEQKLDLGWIINADRPYALMFLPIEVQECFCILPPDSPLAEKGVLRFEDLAGEDFALDLRETYSAMGNLVRERCHQAGYQPKVSVAMKNFPSFDIVERLLRSNYGIMFSPQYAAAQMQGLAVRPMDPPLTLEVGLAWRDKRSLSAEEKAMIAYIQERYPGYAGLGNLADNSKE